MLKMRWEYIYEIYIKKYIYEIYIKIYIYEIYIPISFSTYNFYFNYVYIYNIHIKYNKV